MNILHVQFILFFILHYQELKKVAPISMISNLSIEYIEFHSK